jgi:magnesium-transporting ATPase (P-type)
VREGEEYHIDAADLVPGDIVLLASGDRVPADIRLITADRLTADESLLTGESLPVAKNSDQVPEETFHPGDLTCMVFRGTTILSGRASGVVTATGIHTEIGKISSVITLSGRTKTPLIIRMERFVRTISILTLVLVLILSFIVLAEGYTFEHTFLLAVALAVSAIPEGLPVAITVAFSIAIQRMGMRGVIVRHLTAVEGLGSCTYIATDKTGTLTLNQQTARICLLPDGGRIHISGEGHSGSGTVTLSDGRTPHPPDLERLAAIATTGTLANEGTLWKNGEIWEHSGDMMDVALLAFAWKCGVEPDVVREAFPVEKVIPYESEKGYAAALYRKEGALRIAAKGALEKVLPACSTMLGAGGIVPLDLRRVEEAVEAAAEEGYRVLIVADGEYPPAEMPFHDPDSGLPPGLTLLGCVGFIDPLRNEAKDAVMRCRAAGITVGMVTGDHPATAYSIAHEAGIATSWDQLVTGFELTEAGGPEGAKFRRLVTGARVFARVTPVQKYQIVNALKDSGQYVAVTGDGVNDAPAMHAAHIGVAMGSGTDVTKDTASIIVTDDNFATIVNGIEEGRYAYDNVRKVIYLLIPTAVAEIILMIAALSLGFPLPLLAVQLIWLNLVTNGIQDVALAFEGGEKGAMQRPPRPPAERIFNRRMVEETILSGGTIGAVALLFWAFVSGSGMEESLGRNLLFLLIVLFENVHVFNCRSESVSAFRIPLRRNPFLIFGVAGALLLHVACMYIPAMQQVLRIQPVEPVTFVFLVLLATSVLWVMEGYKLVTAKNAP